jgi:hypothetical protein
MQENYRSIVNKPSNVVISLTHNPDVIIGTDSWLREEISTPVVFSDDYIAFSRDRILEAVECSSV